MLTGVDELVAGEEAVVVAPAVGVEDEDEELVHGDEQVRQLVGRVAAVAPVQRRLQQRLVRPRQLRVDVHVVVAAPEATSSTPSCHSTHSTTRREPAISDVSKRPPSWPNTEQRRFKNFLPCWSGQGLLLL